MRRLAALAAFAVSLPAAAQPLARWTFCIAATSGGDEVFVSEVLAAEGPRARIEAAFAETVARFGASGASALCPNPRVDQGVIRDALSHAEKVDRERGARLHAVAASEFPGSGGSYSAKRAIAGSAAPAQVKR